MAIPISSAIISGMNTKPRTCAGRLFMGLDFSTQRLKATAIDSSLDVVHESEIDFDRALPEFKTRGGVHRHSDGLTVTAPPLLWVARLTSPRCHARAALSFQACDVRFRSTSSTEACLHAMAPTGFSGLDGAALRGQRGCAIPDSPVWMDSSTSAQCRARDRALGGAQAVAALTGSRSCERFTGNQIAKIRSKQPEAYAATGRIALVSSFCASLLIGDYAPIEPGDGAGMNMMNLRTRAWSPAALACTAKGLAARLGAIVPSHTVIGPDFAVVRRAPWLFPRLPRESPFGDNPSQPAALRLGSRGHGNQHGHQRHCSALFLTRPSATEGHIFGSPIDPEGYMAPDRLQERVPDPRVECGTALPAEAGPIRALPCGNPARQSRLHRLLLQEPEMTRRCSGPASGVDDSAAGRSAASTKAKMREAVIEGSSCPCVPARATSGSRRGKYQPPAGVP